MSEKIALVTGATKGLGKALAETLIDLGYIVYAAGRNIANAPEAAIAIELDLANETSIHKCVDQIIHEKGRIDLLVNNAAVAYWGAPDSMTIDEIRNLFEINFFGTIRLTQLVIPYMRENCSGRIVFVSSIRGIESCAYMGMYSATKAAIESVALDWAAALSKWNILVSVVQPGPLDTGIHILHGTHFKQKNPYLPYPEICLQNQDTYEAAHFITKHISDPCPVFRFQTSLSATKIIAKHLIDPSGTKWLNEQKSIVLNS